MEDDQRMRELFRYRFGIIVWVWTVGIIGTEIRRKLEDYRINKKVKKFMEEHKKS